MIKPLLIIVFLLLSSMWASATDESTCDVSVSNPGKQHTYIPLSSTVHINCTGESGQSPVWSVRLTETAVNLHQFSNPASEALLNSRGFYSINLPSDGSDQNVVQLLVNSTSDENNKTLVRCADVASLNIATLFETTLVIYEPSPINFTSRDLGVQSINISWNPLLSLEANHSPAHYFLRVEGHITFNESFQLNQPYYNFTAPEDAPPCEVYNFSVTATYVGATYTGAGCSVPGSESTILPSLPDIVPLDSSLEYVLMKNSSKITLVASFMPANYCEQYPVINYTLEVKGPSSDVLSQSVTPGVENVIHNLTENTNYSFRVSVSNSVGVVSTNRTQIITTDVQNVTATPVETMDAFVVQCDFITGSNAQGCMVVFVGEFYNVTANFSNLEENSSKVVNVSYPLSCYHEIFAFDIESDGSVGTLAVPGVLVTNSIIDIPKLCDPRSTAPSTTPSSQTSLIISVTVSLLVLTVIMSVLVVIFVYCNLRCCLKVNEANICMKPNEVYGVISGGSDIKMTPNEVYGLSLSSQVQ